MSRMQRGPDDPATYRREGRRRFLRQAGVAGAVAWTAPVVLSKPAMAQGTLQCVTMDWPTYFGNGAVANGDNATLGGTTFTISWSDPTTAVSTSAVDATFPRGGNTYHMQLSGAAGDTGPVVITLGFSAAVSSLAFDMLDIDDSSGGSSWQDQISIAAWNGVTALTPTTDWTGTPGGTNVSEIVADVTYRGAGNESNGTTGADVAFSFSSPTDQVQFTYTRAGTVSSQGIGIGSIAWCV